MESILHFSHTTGFWNEFFTTILVCACVCVCVCVCMTYYSQDLWDTFLDKCLQSKFGEEVKVIAAKQA